MKKQRGLPRKLVGRLASALTVGGSVVGFASEVTRTSVALSDFISTFSGLAAGVVLWFLPWDKWGDYGTWGFLFLSLASLFGGAVAESTSAQYTTGIYLVALFVWNGIAHPRWSSVKVAPLAAAAYLGPGLISSSQRVGLAVFLLTLPMAIFLGESVAWVTDKLTTAEQEREAEQIKQRLLTAISHEFRTPLTTISGYAQLLNRKGLQLTPAQLQEYAATIADGTNRLEAMLQRILDIQSLEIGQPLDVTRLGVLGEHYGGRLTEDPALLGQGPSDSNRSADRKPTTEDESNNE